MKESTLGVAVERGGGAVDADVGTVAAALDEGGEQVEHARHAGEDQHLLMAPMQQTQDGANHLELAARLQQIGVDVVVRPLSRLAGR